MQKYFIIIFFIFFADLPLCYASNSGCDIGIFSIVEGKYILGDKKASKENPKCINLNTGEKYCFTSYWVEIYHKSKKGRCYRYIYDMLCSGFENTLYPENRKVFVNKKELIGDFYDEKRNNKPLILEENCDEKYEYKNLEEKYNKK
jgi:hypothetical protein